MVMQFTTIGISSAVSDGRTMQHGRPPTNDPPIVGGPGVGVGPDTSTPGCHQLSNSPERSAKTAASVRRESPSLCRIEDT